MEIVEIPFGYIKDGKIFKKGWENHPDKEIGEVRDENEKKSVAFFQERFEDLTNKVSEVTDKIDQTENKGSFLMKIVHLKDHLGDHDGLGDYLQLSQTLDKYESLIRDIIQKNRKRNTEIKSALLEEGKQFSEIINWREATEKINDLKSRWIKTGNAEEDKNEELENTFWTMVEAFFDRKKKFYEDKQKLTEHRQRQYTDLVEEAKSLSNLHGKERFTKVKELKEKWGEIGGIPADLYGPLNKDFLQALKGKKFIAPTDYSKTLKGLENVKTGKAPYNKDELDKLKKSLFRDKSRSAEKQKCLELIQLLHEREFVLKLANKRFPQYETLDEKKQVEIKVNILRDLLSRDAEDLKTYEDNAANFASADGQMNPLVEGKIKSQRRKIDIKEQLLELFKSGEF